ncbi:E22 family MetX-like putative esterase [Glaciecola sp. 1036]|uniref:E22 family MetX-like putative esterase n=1 Tax=Alteromonadaceae TaxID=72275 RepID=UPI003CFDC2C9
MKLRQLLFTLCFCTLLVNCVNAKDKMLVEKQHHNIKNFNTHFGKTIAEVNVGWESYGKLNDDKSNAILITHFFTGNSHAAGVYSEDDEEPGYWDSIIGPGKAIDTDKFFVISVDSLVNISANNPKVITTGPASINPATGKPYGLDFPVVTMRDFVNAQKSVLDSLGIEKLYAVAGPSMGSMQAIEWASAYPDKVERMISVIGSAGADAWTKALLDQWTWPIKSDPNWQQGNYYNEQQENYPVQGLTLALALITQSALTPAFFNSVEDQLAKISKQQLASSVTQDTAIVKWLMERAGARANQMDANHLLYLVRANQLFLTGMQSDLSSGLERITAKTLFITAKTDLLLMPYHAELAFNQLTSMNKDTQIVYIDGPLGHLEGVAGIQKAATEIKQFLQD